MKTLNLPYFENLTDEQNEYLSKLFSYKIGLFQCFTGFGKSEILATLARYFEDNNIQTLFITSSSAALIELKDRACRKFNVKDPGYYDTNSVINFISSKGFWSSSLSKESDVVKHLESTKVILFDEVEQSLNNSMIESLDTILLNRECMYGFSATTNKVGINRLSPSSEDYFEPNNYRLVSYFGYSTVYLRPNNRVINLVKVSSSKVIKLPGEVEVFDLSYVKDNLYTSDDYINELNNLFTNHVTGTTFIPINRTQVIYSILPRLDSKLNVLILNSTGYTYKGDIITMNEAKKLVNEGKVDLFFSTRSGYNSIDFPKISNIFLMLEERNPSSLLQAVGRSREKEVNIYYINFLNKIPIYSNKVKEQVRLISNYYKLSTITNKYIELK